MTSPKISPPKNAKTLADFRAIHDKSYVVPQKIKAGLEALGKEGWEYEMDFMRLCGVSSTDFASFRSDFLEHYVIVGGASSPKRVWVGSKAIAEKMRGMV